MWNLRHGGGCQELFSEAHQIPQKEQMVTAIAQAQMVAAEELCDAAGVFHEAGPFSASRNVLGSSARAFHDVGVWLFVVGRTSSYLCERKTS